MARPKEGNYKLVTLNLDPKQTDRFVEQLPKHKSLSGVIRDFIQDENDRKAREKKEIGLDNSPIKLNGSKDSKQIALDKYFGEGFMDYENWELRQLVFNSMTEHQKYDTSVALNRHAKAWNSLIVTEQVERKKLR